MDLSALRSFSKFAQAFLRGDLPNPQLVPSAKTTNCLIPPNCLPIEASTSALTGRSVSPSPQRALPPQEAPMGEPIVNDGSPVALPSGSAPERAQATLRHSYSGMAIPAGGPGGGQTNAPFSDAESRTTVGCEEAEGFVRSPTDPPSDHPHPDH